MYLQRLRLTNFRAFSEVEFCDLKNLAVLIGENDVGKSSVLDAIGLLIENSNPSPSDFREDEINRELRDIELEGEFFVEDNDNVDEKYVWNSKIIIRKVFNKDSSKIYIKVKDAVDSRVCNFSDLSAQEQKNLLMEFAIEPEGNASNRQKQIDVLKEDGTVEMGFVERNISTQVYSRDIRVFLPMLERINTTEYKSPETVIIRGLRSVFQNIISSPSDNSSLSDELKELSTNVKLEFDKYISSATEIIQRLHNNIKSVKIEPNIDFSKALTSATLVIDTGYGDKGLETFGEGTKKRIWMTLVEWDQSIQRSFGRNVIRLYDEPDANLHYGAQKKVFDGIVKMTEGGNVQCIVCTHSVTMIDRSPLNRIYYLSNTGITRSIQRLDEYDQETEFLDDIGRGLGLTIQYLTKA